MEGSLQPQDNRGIDVQAVFGHNRHFAFVYKKTEKLVTALYMITNFIKDNEPLKWKIREAALSLMELNIDWTAVSLAERRDLIKEYQTCALEIVSLSSVAFHSGLISEMNFNILAREFNSLVSIMGKDENKGANEQTVMLDPGFFDSTEPEPLRPASATHMSHTPQQVSQTNQQQNAAPIHKGQSSRTSISHGETASASRKPEDTKDGRQATIIKLLSKKSGLNIKDFADSIKGVSEKTIQRELLAMVAAGVLKKEGERRWSTYSLAS